MTNPQQPDLFPVERKPTKRSHKRRYVFEALCQVEGLDPQHPGKIGGGMIQRWEKELRDRHGVPDTLNGLDLVTKQAAAYKVHPTYGAAGMPLTAKALVDAWPRLTQTKRPMRPYDLTEKEQAERDRVSAEEKKAVRRNKIQRQIAKDIIDEHGGDNAPEIQRIYQDVIKPKHEYALGSSTWAPTFAFCMQEIAEALAPGEIAKRLDEMRQSWLRRHHETAEAIVGEADPAAVEAAWATLQEKRPLGMKKSSTMEQWLGGVADLVSPGELARRMETSDEATGD